MNGPRLAAALALTVLAPTVLASGCASDSGTSARQTSSAPRAVAAEGLSASTTLTAPDGTWAVVPMGGTGPNLFWQLFSLPSAGGQWSLETPPAVATNGAIILAPQDGAGKSANALTVGIRPSLDLSFSPFTVTNDGGRSWNTIAPGSGLANVPDALAAAPAGQLVALGLNQRVSEMASAAAPGWNTLTSQRALASTAAGRECSLTGLTSVAYEEAGTALVGGSCGKAGEVGIFAYSGGTWRLAGPALPASLSGSPVQVLRLTRVGDTDVALLAAGTGSSAALVAAWSSGDAGGWTLSPAFRLSGAQPVSASFGAGGVGVVLTGNRGVILQGPNSAWRPVPGLPPGQADTLALPSAGTTEALVADGSLLTVWRLGGAPARWSRAQQVKVPIEYGSSS
jgi:hypothetical protein